MPPAAPVRELITGIVPVAALALMAACKEDRPASPAPHVPAPIAVAATSPADAAVVADAGTAAASPPEPRNTITFTLAPPRAPGSELARRCTLEGDPLIRPCTGHSRGIAVARDGTLYVIAGDGVRRYVREDGQDCRYAPRGTPIPLPPDRPRAQKLDGGPVYMRSGGPAWHLARSGNAIYAVDYLGGLYRLDGGAFRPACTEVFGYDHLATHRGKLLVARRSIEQLVLGKGGRCKAVPVTSYPMARRGDLHVVGDELYLAGGRELTRYEGTTPTKLAEAARMCFVTDVTACGDGACVLDNNCMKLVQLDARGEVVRTIDGDALFATRPLGASDAITLDSGAVLVLASHRDAAAGEETCESVIYELPATVFAR